MKRILYHPHRLMMMNPSSIGFGKIPILISHHSDEFGSRLLSARVNSRNLAMWPFEWCILNVTIFRILIAIQFFIAVSGCVCFPWAYQWEQRYCSLSLLFLMRSFCFTRRLTMCSGWTRCWFKDYGISYFYLQTFLCLFCFLLLICLLNLKGSLGTKRYNIVWHLYFLKFKWLRWFSMLINMLQTISGFSWKVLWNCSSSHLSRICHTWNFTHPCSHSQSRQICFRRIV